MEQCLSPVQLPAHHLALSPSQQSAVAAVLAALDLSDLVILQGEAGRGKSTILQHVHETKGGVFLGMRDFMQTLAAYPPVAIEEAWLALIDASMVQADFVIMDDMHLLTNVCTHYNYPRAGLFDVALVAVLDQAQKCRKKLMFGFAGDAPEPIAGRAQTCKIGDFTPDDYAAICQSYLNAKSDHLDYAKIHRFAPNSTPVSYAPRAFV